MDNKATTANAGLKDHVGRDVAAERMDLFAPAPAEIGKVLSAWSDVKVGGVRVPFWGKVGVSVLAAAGAVGFIVWLKNSPDQSPDLWKIVVCLGLLGVAILVPAISFKKRYLTYIGEEGAAVYTTRGSGEGASLQVARFAEVGDVKLTQNRRVKNGVYLGTEFECVVKDNGGRQLMKVGGNFIEVANQRPVDHLVNFLGVTEIAKKAFDERKGKAQG